MPVVAITPNAAVEIIWKLGVVREDEDLRESHEITVEEIESFLRNFHPKNTTVKVDIPQRVLQVIANELEDSAKIAFNNDEMGDYRSFLTAAKRARVALTEG